MKILFLTKNHKMAQNINRTLAYRFKDYRFNTAVFCSTFKEAHTLAIEQDCDFDLLISEISFQQSNIPLQNLLSKPDKTVAVVFIDDPYCAEQTTEERIWYWLKQNIDALEIAKLPEKDYIYRKYFETIEPFYNPLKSKPALKITPYNTTPAISRLFNYFKNNMESEIDSETIQNFLHTSNSSSVYTYISRLKKMLIENNLSLEIIRTGNGKYSMFSV